jgi:hypothetical protein
VTNVATMLPKSNPTDHGVPTAPAIVQADLPSAVVPDPAAVTWQQLRAAANSYDSIASLLIEAGIGLFQLVQRDDDLQMAYDLLQMAIGIVDERAQGEAEGDDVPEAETVPAIPAPSWWPAAKPRLRCCEGFHDTDSAHADEICSGPGWEVPTSLPPVEESDEDGSYFLLGVSQHVDDDQPRIWAGVGDSRLGRHLTAAGARNLAAVLLDASEKAEVFA